MSESRLPRRLAAILYADVADYSRLTAMDEDSTHRRLAEYLDIFSAGVSSHRGAGLSPITQSTMIASGHGFRRFAPMLAINRKNAT